MPTAKLTAGTIILIAGALMASPASGQPRAPIDPKVKAEVATVDAQIAAAETENAKYTGGLVKALVESRIAILKQTRAMLTQRATAGDLNVAIRYTVDGKPFVLPQGTEAALSAVEAEIEANNFKVAAAEREAAKYSGGLIQAISLTTVATMQQTQAMLEQKRLSLKYGLPQFVGFGQANNSGICLAGQHHAGPPLTPITSHRGAEAQRFWACTARLNLR